MSTAAEISLLSNMLNDKFSTIKHNSTISVDPNLILIGMLLVFFYIMEKSFHDIKKHNFFNNKYIIYTND